MSKPKKNVVLAVHGGAGIILPDNLSEEMELKYRSALEEALRTGYDVLQTEQPTLDVAVYAAEAAVKFMEQCPLFNAGKGSVFASDEKIRMDASIMGCYLDVEHSLYGQDEIGNTFEAGNIISAHQIIQQRKHPVKPHPKAGSVAGVSQIQNPILLARQIMEKTPHVMLIGKGAEDFAHTLPPDCGIKFQPDEYFWTEKRWNQLLSVREIERNKRNGESMIVQLDHSSKPTSNESCAVDSAIELNCDGDAHKFGTVGCVALYRPDTKKINSIGRAQLASATSTGGMTNQRYHRVGDSPIIGAGTYCNSLSAVSCTGHGEWFIQCVAAHDVVKRLEYKYNNDTDRGIALQKAVDEVIFGTLMGDDECGKTGGDGGLIALDRNGNFVASMNCSGMYHGWIYENGEVETRIFWDEETS